MPNDFIQQSTALAAVFQGAYLVQQLARTGDCDQEALRLLIKSLAIDTPNNVQDIYPEKSLTIGYKAIINCINYKTDDNTATTISEKTKRSLEVIKYVYSFIVIEKQIRKNTELMNAISNDIENVKNFARQNNKLVLDEEVLQRLADIYISKISNSQNFKILIFGSKLYLSQEHIQAKIRSIILAALRATSIWRSNGGNRLKLYFQRKKLLSYCSNILKRC